MLKELHLRHWKSFRDATLHIDPLTVLIGTNASGKSNIVDALLFMQRVVSGIDPTQALNGTENLPPVRGGLKWAVTRGHHDFFLSGVFDADETQKNSSLDFVYSIDARIQANKCDLKSLYNVRQYLDSHMNNNFQECSLAEYILDKKSRHVARKIRQDTNSRTPLKGYHQLLIDVFKNIFILNPTPPRMREYSTITDIMQPDASNTASVMASMDLDSLNKFNELIKKYLKYLPDGDIHRIWAEQEGPDLNCFIIKCEEKWHDGNGTTQTMDARSMSDGTLRLLAILTALFTRPPGSLLVIEDVDQGLHPSRAGILVQMLKEEGKNRGVDLLVTTHNPALLDAMGPDMLPYITVVHRDPDTGESRLTLLEEAPQLAKLLAYGPVGRLATSGRIEEALRTRGTKAHGE
ncbi:MAG: AAA family ATPase [Magnetococcales bacterium]|nr:AAA family ATPase [Magnetococcales bacterium]